MVRLKRLPISHRAVIDMLAAKAEEHRGKIVYFPTMLVVSLGFSLSDVYPTGYMVFNLCALLAVVSGLFLVGIFVIWGWLLGTKNILVPAYENSNRMLAVRGHFRSARLACSATIACCIMLMVSLDWTIAPWLRRIIFCHTVALSIASGFMVARLAGFFACFSLERD